MPGTISNATVIERATLLEQQAHDLHAQQQVDAAFKAYDEAAALYRDAGEHFKAATCFASAATCWNIKAGWQPLRDAATRTDQAAQEAMKAGHYDYARTLYREAALLYEKEGDVENYSVCFVASQMADLKRSWATVAGPTIQEGIHGRIRWKDRLSALIRCALNLNSRLLWGYGEYPLRTLTCMATVIVGSACLYALSGHILTDGAPRAISFIEALYLSVITFSTVGYGDYLPLGWTRFIAGFEAISGVTLMPLFLVGLSRRYLRLYR